MPQRGEVRTMNDVVYISVQDQRGQKHCSEKYSACYWVMRNGHDICFSRSQDRMYDHMETMKPFVALIKTKSKKRGCKYHGPLLHFSAIRWPTVSIVTVRGALEIKPLDHCGVPCEPCLTVFPPCCIHNGPCFTTSSLPKSFTKRKKSSNISDVALITQSINVVRRVRLSDWINGAAGCWIKFIRKQEETLHVKPEEILNPGKWLPPSCWGWWKHLPSSMFLHMPVISSSLSVQHHRTPLGDLYSPWVPKQCEMCFVFCSKSSPLPF